MAKQKPQPEILDWAQLQIRRHDATVAMLDALKTAENWLPDAPIQRGALLKIRAAIAQAEAAGFKVPS